MPTQRSTLFLAAILALSQAPVLAQSAAPVLQDFGGISVISGGFDREEAKDMKRLAGPYRLQLLFVNRRGEYEVARSLRIVQRGQTLVDLADAGPWVLADLAPGRYQLIAEVGGERLEKTVTLGSKVQVVQWMRPAPLF